MPGREVFVGGQYSSNNLTDKAREKLEVSCCEENFSNRNHKKRLILNVKYQS